MPNSLTGGHDLPIRAPQDDAFDGEVLARAICQVIRTAPPQWSTRIGLRGAWGSGKTSVLYLLSRLLEEDATVIVYLSAWSADEPGQILLKLRDELELVLKTRGLSSPFERRARWLSRWVPRMPFRPIAKATETAAVAHGMPVSGAAEILSKGIEVFGSLMLPSRKQIERMVESLRGTRVVVFVDDLDRADPKAIPKTLLALRELFDWPLFTFVVAYDSQVVEAALVEYSKAFGERATQFLEKVIDVPFHMPATTLGQRESFMRRILASINGVPTELVSEVRDFLPPQPRSMKLFARRLKALAPTLLRFDEDELDLIGIALFILLQDRSARVATFVLDQVTDEKNAFSLVVPDRGERENAKAALLEKLATVARRDVEDDAVAGVSELGFTLIERWVYQDAETIQKYATLLSNAPAVTKREFRKAFIAWRTTRVLPSASGLRPERSFASPRALAEAIVDVAVSEYSDALSAMAQSRDDDELVANLTDAAGHLAFLEQLWITDDPPIQSARRATGVSRSFIGLSRSWVAWTHNEGEEDLRQREASLCQRILQEADDPGSLYWQVDRSTDWSQSPQEATAATSWRDTLRNLILPRVVEIVVAAAGESRGFERLFKEVSENAYIYLIESPDSLLYVSEARTGALAAAMTRENADFYFGAVFGKRASGTYAGPSAVKKIHAVAPGLLPSIWSTLVSQKVPFRVMSSLLDVRAELVCQGVDPTVIPLPSWLAEGAAKLNSHRHAPDTEQAGRADT